MPLIRGCSLATGMEGSVLRRVILHLLLCLMVPSRAGGAGGHDALSHPLHAASTNGTSIPSPPEVTPTHDVIADPERRYPECIRCKQRQRTTVFLPCSHRMMCSSCADVTETCPLCEQTISATVLVESSKLGIVDW